MMAEARAMGLTVYIDCYKSLAYCTILKSYTGSTVIADPPPPKRATVLIYTRHKG